MAEKKTLPYGSWRSPISSDLIVATSIGLSEVTLQGDAICWIEMRPEENGRHVVVGRDSKGNTRDLIRAPFNARTRVHEYGGGSYLLAGDSLYFSNFADQRLYRVSSGAAPEPLTSEGDFRYADAVMDHGRARLICVREDHSQAGSEAVNSLVSVPLLTTRASSACVLAAGADFYANPRLSPDGRYLSWLAWNHPNMPWDGTELWVGEMRADGQIGNARKVAGGPEESVFQPEWSPDGSLYFVSDRTLWWNLYRWHGGRVSHLVPMEAEFGAPQWVLRESTYAFAGPKTIIATYSRDGIDHLARIDTDTGALQAIETPYTDIGSIQADKRQALFLAASPGEFPSILRMDLASHRLEILKRASSMTLDPGYIAVGEPVAFPTDNHVAAHGFYYPPTHAELAGPPEEQPPLIVMSHGGPTASAHNGLRLGIQFFTSRGFAVLDVNYGGSTGFGRVYRQRLSGQWGIVDVNDCTNGALYLASQGKVDRARLAIRGGSAGGFTTLAALTFRDVFKAGASHYGVSDLEALARDTHKFESRYLDTLIGPYPTTAELYRQRSPINAVERLSCPIIFFQGLEDKVVPPSQTERMVEALKRKGIPVAYLAFEGEQHGFRQAKNIKRALDAELYFYSQILGFDLADPVEPVPIDNLDRRPSR